MSYASILGAAGKSLSQEAGALSEAESMVRDELIVAGDDATKAYSLIKGAVLSNVKVDLQQGIQVQWDAMAKEITGGAVQLGVSGLQSLVGGSTKFMNEIGAAAASIFAGAIEAASSGNWGKFAVDTVLEVVNIVDDIIQEILKELITELVGAAVDAVGAAVGAIPIVGQIVGIVLGVVKLVMAMEDGRNKLARAYASKDPELCEQLYKSDVIQSGKNQMPVDLFVQVAAGPCSPENIYMGQLECDGAGSATLCPVVASPHSIVQRATAWGPYCVPGLENQSTSVLNVGGYEAKKFGLTYASLLDDMQKYQQDWYRFGRGRLTRVPHIGKALMIVTEQNPGLDYSRRNFYRSTRMAIQRTFWAGGDGGATLLPLYVDALKADRRMNALSDAKMYKMLEDNFQMSISFPKRTLPCEQFAKWAGLESIKQITANWSRDTETAMYAADQQAADEMRASIKKAKAALKEKNKGKILTLAPSAYKRVMFKPKARSGAAGGSVLPLGLLVGGIATLMFLARQQPRKRAYSY